MTSKTELRAILLARRQGRPPHEVAERSARLVAHLLAHPLWRDAGSLAAFVGVRGEPDTTALLAAALAAGKRLWLPRMTGPRGQQHIEFAAVDDLAALAPAGFGLLEPPAGPGGSLADADVDLVLVPGLGFSRAGVRLGFGKGHYDRALAPLRDAPRPVRVGVCFAGELDPAEGQVPEDSHDVRVHWVATEDGLSLCAG